MKDKHIDYPERIDAAMRGMVREVLREACAQGLPGDHHFYISFNTNFAGVNISEQLREKYPKEMTIVLQHQFWDFKVEDVRFFVTLSFGGIPEKLVIPFAALTAFADPSVKFGLQFQHLDISDIEGMEMEDVQLPFESLQQTASEAISAEVISLDSFRKK